MKIAILSDIKSNVYALEEVLIDATKKKVDAVLNLGDSFYGPVSPRETYDLIRQSAFINICGDNDRKILEASLEQLEEDKLLKYVYNDLGEDVLYWIQELPFEKLIGEDFYMIHGTYYDDSDYLLEENGEKRDDKKIIELLDDIKSQFIFCSNNSNEKCIRLETGQIVLNPGSLGLDSSGNICQEATYAILDISDNGFEAKFVKVPYDYEKAIKSKKFKE